jgi:DNA-binding NarL/FixJ family response regulator
MFPARFTAKDEYAQDRLESDIVLHLPTDQAAHLPRNNQAPGWLKCLLNDVGFGILILDPDLNVCFCNDNAKAALDAAGFGRLLTNLAETTQADHDAIKSSASSELKKFFSSAKLAVKGQRKLILLGEGTNQIAAALSPINLGEQYAQHGVLVTTERKTVCETISLWAYGRVQGLTSGELKVLEFLANCQEPKEVAGSLKISLSTVRTHIRSIVSKTDSSSMRDLLLRVAKLPPIRTLPCCINE